MVCTGVTVVINQNLGAERRETASRTATASMHLLSVMRNRHTSPLAVNALCFRQHTDEYIQIGKALSRGTRLFLD